MSKKRVTINDLAKKLNVTPSTISRALADNKRVSLKTRELVKATAKEMHYQPNVIASALRKGTSDTIGMIVPRINRNFFSNAISGVENILNPVGYNLVICQTEENENREHKAVESLIQNQVGGILISLSSETKDLSHLKRITNNKTPLVQFDRVTNLIDSPKITNNNFTGSYLATKELIKAGYRNIGHFGGELSMSAYEERYLGYVKAMEEANLSINKALVLNNTITKEKGFSEIIRLRKETNIDALSCAGDYAALGVLKGLQSLRIAVPEQFGIIGFANEPFAELISPSLSSVEQNAFEMGQKSAQALLRLIKGEHVEQEQTVPVNIITRQSSGRHTL